ncbi:hypothetical protein H1C71_028470, partial [Ictidomys tridecemlineatus]
SSPAWTGCQGSLTPQFINSNKTFTFPLITTYKNATFLGFNFTYNNPTQAAFSNPFDSWVLCTRLGACSQLNALGFIDGGSVQKCNYTYNTSAGSFEEQVKVNCSDLFRFAPTPVCVWPPFMLLMFNYSSPLLNCSNQTCRLVQCWNASLEDSVVVVRVPSYLPLPVSIDDDNLPVLLQRNKRDLGITAAIVAAVAASAVATATAAAALATAVLTADAVNKLAGTAATAMETQTMMNQHLHRGIVLLNQQVDLLQDQVDILSQVLTHGCLLPMDGLCITPLAFNNLTRAANLSRKLGAMLTGVWSAEFDNLTMLLRQEIVRVNNTRVQIAPMKDVISWLSKFFSFSKQWAGMGALAVVLVLAIVLYLWCLVCMRRWQRVRNLMLIQAFAALEAGQSPQAWLTMLK